MISQTDAEDAFKAIRRFCERVEAGEVQSIRTYLEFQYALGTPWKPGCVCINLAPVRSDNPVPFVIRCPKCGVAWERFQTFVKPD